MTRRRAAVYLGIPASALFTGLFACKRRRPIDLTGSDDGRPLLLTEFGFGDPAAEVQLLSGFHGVEQGSWRWTESKFRVTLRTPPGSENGAVLTLRFTLPDAVFAVLKATTIRALVNNTLIGSEEYKTPGEHVFRATIPAAKLAEQQAITVSFELDRFTPRGKIDARELGMVANFISLTSN